MNTFGKIGQFILNNQEVLQDIVIYVLVILCIIFLVFLYRKISNASKRKTESYDKIEGILEDISGNISQLKKQGDFIYIDNSSKKDHEQEALDEAMILAKSSREMPREPKEVADIQARDKTVSDTDVLCDSIRESAIEKIINASGVGVDLDSKTSPKRKFESRSDSVDKFGRVYNVEELEKQIRD